MNPSNNPNRPIPNSYWVTPRRFAAGEYPAEVEPRAAAKKLRALLESGINHFIDLTESGETTDQGKLVPYLEIADEEARKLGQSVTWARYPIVDTTVPHSPECMAEILNAIDSALNDGKTVYVHCWGGVGRTGTVVGCWLVRQGHTGQEALDRIASDWQGVEKFYRQPRSPNRQCQREYVRQWQEPPKTEADNE